MIDTARGRGGRRRRSHGAPALEINSAGAQLDKAFAELTGDEFDFVVGVNLAGSRNFAAVVLILGLRLQF